MDPIASVVILNWNGLHHLRQCLSTLREQSLSGYETVVVDNGSTDGSPNFVRDDFPEVRLVALPENVGFAAGNNAALPLARGKYLVTLNNDTIPHPRWLEKLVAAAEADPSLGMVGSRICAFPETDVIDSIGIGVCRDGMSRGRFRGRKVADVASEGVVEILAPSACAALYRREMIDEIGFFDPSFFAYCEDTDLGLRARLSGWGAVAALEAVVHHKYSQTGGGLSPFKLYLVERNHYWVAAKTFPAARLLQMPLWTAARYLVQARALASRRGTGAAVTSPAAGGDAARAVMRGVWDAMSGLPAMLVERKKAMSHRRLGIRRFSRLLDTYRMSFRELLDMET